MMVKEIMKDPLFLSMKSTDATKEDLSIGQDLLDTLSANRDRCVGMAANMIGELKRVIVFEDHGTLTVMYNPEIIKSAGPYTAEEGCLSLPGARTAKRWKSIKVRYQNQDFAVRIKTFTDFTAQIIQHEIDHCNGILI